MFEELIIPKLKRRDIAPPGGFTVVSPLGLAFHSDTFSEIEERFAAHLKGNGRLPQDAGPMIEIHTAKRLQREGYDEWVM